MIAIRPVGIEDLAVICGHRHRMFADNGFAATTLDAMDGPFAAWLAPKLADGSYFGFVAEDAGAVVAGIGLVLVDWPPHPLHPLNDERGYILNVYVEPSHRGTGLAVELMRRSMEEFERRGVPYVTLHASGMGRPVYEKLGWSTTTEMAKALG
jgi:GNAT superfamily N-acetyltransferase